MDDRTNKALEASIKHWEQNLVAELPGAASIAYYHCALCNLFNTDGHGDCHGCPVSTKTEAAYCDNTPYEIASIKYFAWRRTRDDESKNEFRLAAQDELDFLRSLLPAEEGER